MKRVVIVDDMQSARNVLVYLLKQYAQLQVIGTFSNGEDFLAYMETTDIDLVFLDIEMPGLDGLTISKIISQRKNPPLFAFATAYSQYSLEAWGTNAIGYITKPYNKEDLHKIINKFLEISPEDTKNIRIECFPNFNIYINNEPLTFKSKKSKEILAYLVYNHGGWVEINEMCTELLEDLENKKAQDSLRSHMSRLSRTLDSYGIAEIMEKKYGKCRICRDMLTCDYYDYLDGNRNLFTGEFLKSYSWAELTKENMQLNL